jgi:pilus assembly protein Flp/PilA
MVDTALYCVSARGLRSRSALRGVDGTWILPAGQSPGKEVMRSVIQLGLSWLAGLRTRLADEDGQGLAEYALILGLIAMVAIIALIFMGGQISDKITVVGDTLASHAP